MSAFIKNALVKECPISITNDVIKKLEYLVRSFEIRNDHPQVLNGALLGVYPIKFVSEDKSAIFEIFGYTESDIEEALNSAPSINKEWKVSSDSFNLFCEYILWCINNSQLSKTDKEKTLKNVSMYMQFKLFSSVVNNSWKHGANRDVMTIVMESLTNKFDIKVYGTWKRVMESRTEMMVLSDKSIHHHALTRFDDDKAIFYFITDIQTRIRTQITTIANIYYIMHNDNNQIKSVNMDKEIDGDRIMRDRQASVDIMKSTIIAQIKFGQINESFLKIVSSQFTVLSVDMLKKTLLMMNYIYNDQLKNKTTELITPIKDKDAGGAKEHLVGIDVLVESLISGSLKMLNEHKSDIRNMVRVLYLLKRTYTASRLSDTALLNVKYSLKKMIMDSAITKREATLSSLVPCIELYLILTSLNTITKDS